MALSRNMVERMAVALIAIPAIVWTCYAGGWWLRSFLLLVSALSAAEFLRGTDISGYTRSIKGVMILSWVAAVAIALVHLVAGPGAALSAFMIYALATGMLLSLRSETPAKLYQLLTQLCWGVFYVSMLYPYVFLVREMDGTEGFAWLLTLLGTIWICDTVAMGFGRAFGSRKLAPSVSPNKTVVGFASGLMASIPIGYALGSWFFETESALVVTAGAFLISLFGQLGDLVESMWKRSCGLKDSSQIIPGHGGVMDRFDSLAFAAPALYFFLALKTEFNFFG